MMKLRRALAALLMIVSIPLLANAGPILTFNGGDHRNGDQDKWSVTLPPGWDINGGARWFEQGDRPGHNRTDTDFGDRELDWRHGPSHDNHDRDGDSNGRCGYGGHNDPNPPGWNQWGDQDNRGGTNTVPDSVPTASLLGGTFLCLLVLASRRQAKLAVATSGH
jgi:hypothetical protein